ncbi:37S ribosomal protein subunit sws2, mitochondrial [Teratosphaeria destructans]|uniref:37S ribosomal protein subunit sws2, mitochondrial n=1 Tax=Teratosphaeria destructans TaxID=418781 RepID=A0A9W7W6F7_9PEZI|nr:37S ribosomal protein subunit sws2, mitochondrial [Teratosphaeria destructans]
MVFIHGTNFIESSLVTRALKSFYGIGPDVCTKLMAKFHIHKTARVGQLATRQIDDLAQELSTMTLENDLRRQLVDNIQRLRDMGTYRDSDGAKTQQGGEARLRSWEQIMQREEKAMRLSSVEVSQVHYPFRLRCYQCYEDAGGYTFDEEDLSRRLAQNKHQLPIDYRFVSTNGSAGISGSAWALYPPACSSRAPASTYRRRVVRCTFLKIMPFISISIRHKNLPTRTSITRIIMAELALWQLDKEYYSISQEHDLVLRSIDALSETTHFETLLYNPEIKEHKQTVVDPKDDHPVALATWLKILQGAGENDASGDTNITVEHMTIEHVWHILAIAFKYGFNPKMPAAKAWFDKCQKELRDDYYAGIRHGSIDRRQVIEWAHAEDHSQQDAGTDGLANDP